MAITIGRYIVTSTSASSATRANRITVWRDGVNVLRIVYPHRDPLGYLREHRGRYRDQFYRLCQQERIPQNVIDAVLEIDSG